MNEQILRRAGEIIAANTREGTHCVLAQTDLDGFPTASAITISKAEGIAWMTFCTGYGTRTKRLAQCDKACVCLCSEEYNITLIGRLSVVTDPAVKKEMWYAGMANHFSGPEDPGYCVLRFDTLRYNLLVDWQEARGALAQE